MKKLLMTCAAMALSAYGLSPVYAQDTAPSSPSMQGQQTMSPAQNQQAAPPAQGQQAMPSQGQATTADLTGQTIYSAKGSKIGTVSAMTVDAQGQQDAVVSVERFLGMGGKSVLFPVSSLQPKSSGGYATTLTAKEIKKLHEYKGGGSD